jgi:zinc transport system substrate-binding protein
MVGTKGEDMVSAAAKWMTAGGLCLIFFAAIGAAWLAGCSRGEESGAVEGPLVVFVSVPPQASLVRAIGGPNVETHTLVRPGQDPHLFEPSPTQLRTLSRARLFLTVGMPFESPILKKIEDHLPNMEVVDASAGLNRRPACDCGHAHHHEHHAHHDLSASSDPHVWLSPAGLKAIARNTAESLARIDPDHANDYRRRLKQVNASIDEADEHAKRVLQPHRGRAIYVFHPAFGYFCDAYGLEQKTVETEGKSPNSRQLRDLVHQAKEDQAKTIFVQGQFEQSSARVVAQAMGARIVEADPLAEDAVANLARLADVFASGLPKKTPSRE